MTLDACQTYLEDPEGQQSHLQSCTACRELAAQLSAPVDAAPLALPDLPLAPWEGAKHRAWPLVVVAGALTVAVAAILFLIVGVSPLKGFAETVLSSVPSLDVVMRVARLTGGALQTAPTAWQIFIAVSFVIVNTILFLLLRRAPRGLDV